MKKLVLCIVGVLCLAFFSFISYKFYWQYEFPYIDLMKNPETIDRSKEMANEELFRNLIIIAKREGVSAQHFQSGDHNNLVSSIWVSETVLFRDGVSTAGEKLHYDLMGRFSAGERKPLEIRFIMQSFLYLRGRKLNDQPDGFLEISCRFTRNPLYAFENGRYLKICTDEFEELYEEYNAEELSHEKRVEVLAHAWIYKTGYTRGGLDKKYSEPPLTR